MARCGANWGLATIRHLRISAPLTHARLACNVDGVITMKPVTTFRSLLVAAALLSGAGHAFAATVDAIAVDDDRGDKGGDAGYGVGGGRSAEEGGREGQRRGRA